MINRRRILCHGTGLLPLLKKVPREQEPEPLLTTKSLKAIAAEMLPSGRMFVADRLFADLMLEISERTSIRTEKELRDCISLGLAEALKHDAHQTRLYNADKCYFSHVGLIRIMIQNLPEHFEYTSRRRLAWERENPIKG